MTKGIYINLLHGYLIDSVGNIKYLTSEQKALLEGMQIESDGDIVYFLEDKTGNNAQIIRQLGLDPATLIGGD